ncbi:hypothetical protein BT69DRAFT_1328186 [Atractiella rhizophila]|nr:hypothetical protein BT69DRAFT_1328186 [Atractiella rhizophila]
MLSFTLLALLWLFLFLKFPQHTSATGFSIPLPYFNSVPSTIAAFFSLRPLRTFYAVGAFFVLLSLVAAWVALLLLAFSPILQRSNQHPDNSDGGVKLLLPGLTIPWLQFLTVVLPALVFAQSFHELGHGLAGVAHANPPSMHTLTLLPPFFPALSVTFPDRASHSLRPSLSASARFRVAAAGVWHNVLICFLLLLPLPSPSFLLYRHRMGGEGVFVYAVEGNSPLRSEVMSGEEIVRVDDHPVTAVFGQEGKDEWTSYLLHPNVHLEKWDRQGWCYPISMSRSSTTACCDTPDLDLLENGEPLTCMETLPLPPSTAKDACVDPFVLLLASPPLKRCTNDEECARSKDKDVFKEEWCLRPMETEHLIRLSLRNTVVNESVKQDSERTVLYQGTKRDLYAQIHSGLFVPRFTWLPLSSLYWWKSVTDNCYALSLALAFFNLLPLSQLDGHQMLEILLFEEVDKAEEGFLNAIIRWTTNRKRFALKDRKRLLWWVERVTTGIGLWILGNIVWRLIPG